MPSRRHPDAEDLLHFLRELPPASVPTVVVLNNANFHRAHAARDARPDLPRRGVRLYYLPPSSTELTDIERLVRTIKHHELPERTSATPDRLAEAVTAAFTRREAALADKPSHQPRRAYCRTHPR